MSAIPFGQILREVRKRAGIRQAELADIIEVSQPYISFLETGKRYPNIYDVEDMAAYLGASPQETRAMCESLVSAGYFVKVEPS